MASDLESLAGYVTELAESVNISLREELKMLQRIAALEKDVFVLKQIAKTSLNK